MLAKVNPSLKRVAASFALLFLAIGFLPKIASTPLGKPFFIKAIEQKTGLTIEIESLHLSWLGPQRFGNMKTMEGDLSASIEELDLAAPFWSFSGPFRIKNGSIAYREGRIEQIQGQISGNELTLSATPPQGHVFVHGNVVSKQTFDLQIDIREFPLAIFQPAVHQILGSSVDISGTIQTSQGKGAVNLAVAAPNFKTHFIGGFTKQSVTLNRPLIAQIRLTPQLSTLLLKDANPLFLTALEADHPITLRIEPDDFYVPWPYSIEQLRVQDASLNLGKIRCRNGKSLAAILSLLQPDLFSSGSEMDAWFTPISFGIRQGVLKTERMDALFARSIHLCTWGTIDLLKDRLDMTLGIPGATLEQAFGLKNLPPNYVFTVPVRGTTTDPEISKGAAAAQIAAVIAASRIDGKGIFGPLADVLSKGKKEPPIPPPDRPFPWE